MELVVPGTPELFVVLAVALGALVFAVLLWRRFARRFPQASPPRRLLAVCLAVSSVGVACYALVQASLAVYVWSTGGAPVLVPFMVTAVTVEVMPYCVAAVALFFCSRLALTGVPKNVVT